MARADTLLKLAGALSTDPNTLLAGIQWVPVAPREGAFAFGSVPTFMHREEKKGGADG